MTYKAERDTSVRHVPWSMGDGSEGANMNHATGRASFWLQVVEEVDLASETNASFRGLTTNFRVGSFGG